MRKLLPFPLLWGFLVAMWLALVGSVDPASVVLAALAAGVAVRPLARLLERRPSLGKPLVALELLLVVLADVVRSNVAVAAIVLGLAGRHRRRTGFIEIPLALREPAGLAVLACIITSTPGTAWAGYDAASGVLTMHVFDLKDEGEWVETIRGRYERRLLEIFA